MKLAPPARLLGAATLVLAVLSGAPHASAFPGFFASKKAEPIKTYSTQIAVMKRGSDTVVSVMPDYEGPLDGFALILLVPADVTSDKVTTLKRDFIDRLDSLSAPRFHEYWEQDPCDPGNRRFLTFRLPHYARLSKAHESAWQVTQVRRDRRLHRV